MSQLEIAKMSIEHLIELEKKQNLLEKKQALEAQRTDELERVVKIHDAELERIFKPCGDYYSVMGYLKLHNKGPVSLQKAAALGKKAAKLCREAGLTIEQVTDPRFGKVNTYPEGVLEQVC